MQFRTVHSREHMESRIERGKAVEKSKAWLMKILSRVSLARMMKAATQS